VTLAALDRGVALDDEPGLAAVAHGLDVKFDDHRIRLKGRDVTEEIRTERVSAGASQVAAFPAVRASLVTRQRGFRAFPGLVADGRDMGTVIFPDAIVKVYVTATPEERAKRRYKQLIEKGNSVNIESLLRDILERDARDASRAAAPLKPADDAVLLDTTQMTIDAAVDAVLALYRAAAAKLG